MAIAELGNRIYETSEANRQQLGALFNITRYNFANVQRQVDSLRNRSSIASTAVQDLDDIETSVAEAPPPAPDDRPLTSYDPPDLDIEGIVNQLVDSDASDDEDPILDDEGVDDPVADEMIDDGRDDLQDANAEPSEESSAPPPSDHSSNSATMHLKWQRLILLLARRLLKMIRLISQIPKRTPVLTSNPIVMSPQNSRS